MLRILFSRGILRVVSSPEIADRCGVYYRVIVLMLCCVLRANWRRHYLVTTSLVKKVKRKTPCAAREKIDKMGKYSFKVVSVAVQLMRR